MGDDRYETTASHWSRMSRREKARRIWTQSELVMREMTYRLCGERLTGFMAAINRAVRARYPDRRFSRGISVGCGLARKELLLLKMGLVERFDLIDLSEDLRDQAVSHYEREGFGDRIEYRVTSDALESVSPGAYDLVLWNDSLHHMSDVRQSVRDSRKVLRSGGLFVMRDYTGPDYLQLTEFCEDVVDRILAALPEDLVRDPDNPGESLRPFRQADARQVRATDPSEAPDSSRILPAVREFFPNALVERLGGAVLQFALRKTIANLDDVEHRSYLELILLIDDVARKAGHSHFSFALAERP